MTDFVLGPKFKVGEVEVGDVVTFITKDADVQGTKTGEVERIIEINTSTRKRAFLDARGYVLNGYPDTVTDCYLNIPTPPEEKVRDGQEADAYTNFLKVPVGAVFGVDLWGASSHVWVKIDLNTWRFISIEGAKYTSFDIDEHNDASAFYNLWNEEGKVTFSEDPDTNNWSQDWTDE